MNKTKTLKRLFFAALAIAAAGVTPRLSLAHRCLWAKKPQPTALLSSVMLPTHMYYMALLPINQLPTISQALCAKFAIGTMAHIMVKSLK